MEWFRKSGSGIDQRDDQFYGTIVEAGMLRARGRTLFVAAGITELNDGPLCGDEKELLRENFAARNIRLLGLCDVQLEHVDTLAT